MRSMNHIKSTLIGTALITLFAVACEKDEPAVHELVGTWNSTTETIYYGTSIAAADSSDVDANYTDEVLVFKADNTGTNTSGTEVSDFTWSTEGSNLSVTVDFGGVDLTFSLTYDISGTTLTLTSHEEADTDPDFGYPENWTVTKYTKQ